MTHRIPLTVAWYGGTIRALELVTGTGPWSHIGEALVAVCWVDVHDCTGTHRDEYFCTTDLHLHPKRLVEYDTQRWSIETTFQECREYLQREATKCYSQETVLRFTPCLFGVYPMIVLLYLQLLDSLRSISVLSGHGKTTVSFSEMVRCVRRAIWQQWFFQTPATPPAFSKLPTPLQKTSLYALAPAA